ncbi:sulfate adenylyltransferase subunit 2 [Aureimonas jatrophae]|jgi:sulfate adenylyltransferase subunit 2|uniref:Sulfate adenylyltransferase subunit 2 n=1 Tax=Aureimonas jatrophae TaxID=1166073 RepID=A0A1H0JZ42_9HYPH|nr:sulfate adenylyltransferase subunit 2 [Aureimonas jatrophae]SDO48924.1 sulfate adenylyltransferase subunit 2 [Aureimonas jatrophae]
MTPMTHLQRLEAESIFIIREVAATAENPVMMYSIGKDSAVMLHLALKAFAPGRLPFPVLHVDTTWKFREMIEFRDRTAREKGLDLIVHTNQEGLAAGVNPFDSGSRTHTDIMKTEALKQALNKYKFDAAFGGARRDEEKSRAKERVFSLRTAEHRWDPKSQRPEPWNLFNTRKRQGESFRVFPLSNWTEGDVWDYIAIEGIEVVPLYFAKPRPILRRDGTLIMRDDDRMKLLPGETEEMMTVRFRTLGDYPLTGAVPSTASTLEEVIAEMRASRSSEREGRVIDRDGGASMEEKKQEGYF